MNYRKMYQVLDIKNYTRQKKPEWGIPRKIIAGMYFGRQKSVELLEKYV